LAGFIRNQAPTLVEHGRAATLERWLSWLPKPRVEGDPWLTNWLGCCRLAADPAGSFLLFERAFERFQSLGDAPGIFLTWCGAMDAIRYDWAGSHRRWAAWTERMEEVLREHSFPSPEVECRVARRLTTALDWLTPGNPKADRWRERVLELAGDDLSLHIEALAHAGHIAVLHFGQVRGAQAVDELERTLRAGIPSPYALAGAILAQATHLVRAGCPADAAEKAREGLQIAKTTGVHVWDVLLHAVIGGAALFLGNLREANEAVKTMAALPEAHGGFGAQHYHHLAALVAFQNGRVQEALAHADEWVRTSHQTGFPSYIARAHRLRAQVVRSLGRAQDSWADLREALETCRGVSCPWVEWNCRVEEAHFHLLDGDEKQAVRALAVAFGMGARDGHVDGDIGTLARLCPLALRYGIETKYVRQIIQARGIRPNAAAQTIEDWPWPLRIRSLGAFELSGNGVPRRPPGPPPKKPLVLLRALVAFGSQGVGETKLADSLWPDADGDRQRNALKTTLHRLRKMLGAPEVVQVGDGRVVLDSRHCWVDAWAFERLGREAERSGDPERAGRAVALYRGTFLPEAQDEPWTIAPRDRLRSLYQRVVGRVARDHGRSRRWGEAAACVRQALEREPLTEAFYRELMVCYRELGQTADAIAVYRQCRKLLAEQLGVEPGRETEAVRETLTKQTHR